MAPQDSDGIRHIEDKLDKLIEALPKTYAAQSETDRRFAAIESIIKVMQSQIETWAGVVRADKNWAVGEHQTIHIAISEAERRLMTELKDNTKTTKENARVAAGNRMMVWLAIIGWIVTVLLFIVGILLSHILPLH